VVGLDWRESVVFFQSASYYLLPKLAAPSSSAVGGPVRSTIASLLEVLPPDGDTIPGATRLEITSRVPIV